LTKLLHRTPVAEPDVDSQRAPCMHGALVPRWDSVADMGHEDRATSYRCDSCGAEYTPDEVHALRAEAFDRLKGLSQPPSPN
jgi:hypothetical protein